MVWRKWRPGWIRSGSGFDLPEKIRLRQELEQRMSALEALVSADGRDASPDGAERSSMEAERGDGEPGVSRSAAGKELVAR